MNRIDLEGRNAIVTGAARGIGYAIAERILQSGASCAIWDMNEDRMASAKAALSAHGTVETVKVDISDAGSVEHAMGATLEALGHVDLVVNSAGVAGVSKTAWECGLDEWRQVIDINLWGTYLVCRAAIPQMIDRGYGRIVNIASIAGKEGNPNASHYSASKAGVIGLTKSLGKELATSGVVVNCITPAVIMTEILEQVSQEHIDYMLSKIPMGRAGEPGEVAALVAWLCSEDVSFTTGAVFDISGGRATY